MAVLSIVTEIAIICVISPPLDMDSGLGVLNGGVVFALFDYSPEEAGEIPLTEGERLIVCGREDDKWWQVRNGRGQIGEVPCTFLGLYRPTKDVL